MRNKYLIIFIVILALKGQSFAQKVQPTDKTNQANVERLGRIDRVFQEYVSNQWINGGEVIVYHQDQLIYHKAHGYRDVDQKQLLEKNSIYRMASQTKLITTVGIMMLLERGKFLLNDPISKFLPEFKNPLVLDSYNELDTTFTTIPASREITFKDLLTHTSGIGYPQIGSPQMTAIYYKSGVYGGLGLVNETTLSNQMRLLAKTPLFNQPGEKYTYGLNIDLLGYLIEVISGQSLWDFYQKEIFEPLGMKDTWFFLPEDKYSKLVPLYIETENRTVIKAGEYFDIGGKTLSNYPTAKGSYYSGGAGLSSTAEDYTTFLRMILNGGELNGHKFLSSASIRLMTTNQIGDIEFSTFDGSRTKFGLGLILVTEESDNYTLVTSGSFEAGGAFSTYFWVDPERKIIGQMMLNKFPNSHFDLFRKFQNLVYQALD
jgi:CubicO group peptidase (beta-lactamase class C family)